MMNNEEFRTDLETVIKVIQGFCDYYGIPPSVFLESIKIAGSYTSLEELPEHVFKSC